MSSNESAPQTANHNTTPRLRAGGAALALAIAATGAALTSCDVDKGGELHQGTVAIVCGRTRAAFDGAQGQGSDSVDALRTQFGSPGQRLVVSIPEGGTSGELGAQIMSDNGKVVANVDLVDLQWGTNAVNKSILTGMNGIQLTQSEVEAPSWYSDVETSVPLSDNGQPRNYAGRVTWDVHTTFNDGMHGLGWEATTDLQVTCPENPEAYQLPASAAASPATSAS